MTVATRLIRLSELHELVGLQKSAIYEMVKDGSFPAPVRLGIRAVAWRSDHVQAWINSRPRTTE
jgi:prophage regulatory protein